MNPPIAKPSFRQALPVWVKIGLLSFGGPAGQIALMHRELVEKRGWLDEKRFLHALNVGLGALAGLAWHQCWDSNQANLIAAG